MDNSFQLNKYLTIEIIVCLIIIEGFVRSIEVFCVLETSKTIYNYIFCKQFLLFQLHIVQFKMVGSVTSRFIIRLQQGQLIWPQKHCKLGFNKTFNFLWTESGLCKMKKCQNKKGNENKNDVWLYFQTDQVYALLDFTLLGGNFHNVFHNRKSEKDSLSSVS